MSDHETQKAEPSDSDPEAGSDDPGATPVDDVEPQALDASETKSGEVATPMRAETDWRRTPILWAALASVVGAAVPFVIMCTDTHWAFSVPLGAAGCLVAAIGILAVLRALAKPENPISAAPVAVPKLTARLAELALSLAAHTVVLRLAVVGVLPHPIFASAVLVTATFFWLLISVFRTGQALGAWTTDENGEARGLLQRHGFWLVAITALLYLPMLGNYSLTDPWETHYGEVAREMLARDDWISLWWAQDGWFWSKPVFDFWIQALSFSVLGVRYMPDEMLSSVASGRFPQPEWAARMPVFLLTALGGYLLYKGVARAFGRRAGFIGGLVLATMPYWYFIAHQSMTDAPYVAPFAGAMGLMMLGLFSDPEARVKSYGVRLGKLSFEMSAYHLLIAGILLSVLPQILYLLSRNLMLQIDTSPHGFRPHLDEFFSGSGGGNCGIPGNEACRNSVPVTPLLQPALMGLAWSVLTAAFVWRTRDERRVCRLAFIGAWWLVAISALAKGAPGLVIPVAVLAVFIGATKRWRDVENVELVNLALLMAIVTLPWYVQMYLRHGQQFTDRLLFHDMYKRAFVHVHDTNSGDDTSFRYYVWQLGYGLFPWTGLGAAGLLWWLRRDNEFSNVRGAASGFLVLWFVVAFGLFTVSLTKFHHYVLPAVPAIAMLTGVMIDDWWFERRDQRVELVHSLAAGVAACLIVYGAFRLFGGSLTGVLSAEGARPGPVRWVGVISLLVGASIWIGSVRAAKRQPSSSDAFENRMIGSIALASAIVTFLVGRDLIGPKQNDPEGGKHLLDLFSYNYKRPWPTSLDFSGILAGFTVVGAVAIAIIAAPRLRPHALRLFTASAVVWTLWGLDVYFVSVAPHWGQRETILAYYQRRSGPNEPFIAYQMNWKGENFYTGNRVPAFVSSGEKFKKWVEDRKRDGVRVMFFTTEHGRIGGLKSELGRVRKFETITTKELNNKFVLARAEL